MRDVALAQLAGEIEELRQELNYAVQRNRQNLHAPTVQALSARLDVLIAEFMGYRKKPTSENPLPSFLRQAPPLPRQACGIPMEACPRPVRSGRAWLQEEFRRSGVDAMRVLPWGTHLCQFYRTRQDLIDILVPYFMAGLEHNEFCVWVACEPLGRNLARKAIAGAVPGFETYLKKGQIEILSYSEWYVKDGAFSPQRVLDGWASKLDEALSRGYDGMRVSGNTGWLEPGHWKRFMEYENRVNNVIRGSRVKAICSYPIDKCGPRETAEVLREHRFALIKETDGWQLV